MGNWSASGGSVVVTPLGRVFAKAGTARPRSRSPSSDRRPRSRRPFPGSPSRPGRLHPRRQPGLSRLGLQPGTCHAGKMARTGSSSLRGLRSDLRHPGLTDDMAARRVNIASPDDSLMLLKATGAPSRTWGQLTKPGSRLRDDPAVDRRRAKLDLGVAAGRPGGSRPDRSGDPDDRRPAADAGRRHVCRRQAAGRHRRGVPRQREHRSRRDEPARRRHDAPPRRAPVLVRYEGPTPPTTITAMGDRSGFAWAEPEAWSRSTGWSPASSSG